MQLVNPPLMGVGLGLLVGLTPLGTLLFPPAAGTASSFSAPTPARCPLSAQCSACPAHITKDVAHQSGKHRRSAAALNMVCQGCCKSMTPPGEAASDGFENAAPP